MASIERLSRRSVLKLSALGAGAALLNACTPASTGGGGGAAGRAIKIGYVSPQTGPLAPFGEADTFTVNAMKEILAAGVAVGGTNHPIEVIVKDSQSDPNLAGEAAADLILNDAVDLMLVASTPETTNPVSDQCELNGMPCISTVAPWQPWYLARNPPEGGFKWTYHFFWGLEDIIAVFTDMWGSVDTNKSVGGMWPNDGDGLAWSSPEVGFPPALEAGGYTVVDPGRYENLKDDFSAEISAFKDGSVEIVTGVMIPPDLGTFLTQASQQGFTPKMFTVGKAALFPAVVEGISGGLGEGLTTEIWWTPNHPFNSSLTGASAKDLGAAFETETGKQWTQPIGFIHALFEVAADALKRTTDLEDKASLAAAIKATSLDTIVGKIAWGSGPVPNVAKTPLVGGQWVKGTDHPYDLVITSNSTASNIPTGGTTDVMAWAK